MCDVNNGSHMMSATRSRPTILPMTRTPGFHDLAGAHVLFLDDLLRGPANGLPQHPVNRRWLHGLLQAVMADAGATTAQLGMEHQPEAVRGLMGLLGIAPGPAGWAAAGSLADIPLAAEFWLAAHIGTPDLVVGFELPPFLRRFLGSQGIPFLDMSIAPERFARDLFFSVRTNAPALEARLSRFAATDDIAWMDAALLRGRAIRAHGARLRTDGARIGVFFGQTRIDRALVANGRIQQPSDHLPAIARAFADCDTVLVRPHPAEADNRHLDALRDALPHTEITQVNSYALLAAEDVQRVAALSSSLLTEARYFGRPFQRLVTPDAARADAAWSRPYRLDASLLSAAFWHDGEPPAAPAPGVLRASLGISWGLPADIGAAPPATPWQRARRRLGRLMSRPPAPPAPAAHASAPCRWTSSATP